MTIVAHLRYKVAKHPKDWNTSSKTLTYAHNAQAHHSTNNTQFSLLLSRYSPDPALLPAKPAHQTDVSGNTSVQEKQRALEAHLEALRSGVDTHMLSSRQRYKRYYGRQVSTTSTFTPGDSEFLGRPPLSAVALLKVAVGQRIARNGSSVCVSNLLYVTYVIAFAECVASDNTSCTHGDFGHFA